MGSGVEFMAWRERGEEMLREVEGRHAWRTGAVFGGGRSRFGGRLRSVLDLLRRGRFARDADRFGRRGATAERVR